MVDELIDEEKKAAQVVEYLQGPRKKRKNYVVLALSRSFDPDLSSNISAYIRKNFSQLSVANPKTSEEFEKIFSRQIMLVLVDDNFTNYPALMSMIKQLKEKKREQAVPVIFLTDRVKPLVEAYHETLLAYQEVDNYIRFRLTPHSQIYARIQSTLSQKGARRSRRYDFNIAVKYFLLRKNSYLDGRVVEMSGHGGVVQSTKDEIFNEGDQLKIQIPILGYLPNIEGDFLRISARIRRVLMGGSKAAFSWEYLSQEKYVSLTAFILEYVNHHVLRKKNRRR